LDPDVKCFSFLPAWRSARGWLWLWLGFLLSPSAPGFAQEAPVVAPAPVRPGRDDHAPRAYAVVLAGSYTFHNRLPVSEDSRSYRPAGLQIGGRFGWQVRGLRGGSPSTVGIESDFMYQPGRGAARSDYGIVYGVFAKHSFSTSVRARPYFAYGLGAAQIWIEDIAGRGLGHATRLAFGLDTRLRDRMYLTFALSYQGIIMPNFVLRDRPPLDTSFHSLLLSTGLWFGA
jgi:hypothetical protein